MSLRRSPRRAGACLPRDHPDGIQRKGVSRLKKEVKWDESRVPKIWGKALHTDEEAFQGPCTAQAIIYNTFLMAILTALRVKKFSLPRG